MILDGDDERLHEGHAGRGEREGEDDHPGRGWQRSVRRRGDSGVTHAASSPACVSAPYSELIVRSVRPGRTLAGNQCATDGVHQA